MPRLLRILDRTQLRHTHLASLLWTSGEPFAEAATYRAHNQHTTQTSMPSEGLKTQDIVVQESPPIGLEAWYQLAAKHIQMKCRMVE